MTELDFAGKIHDLGGRAYLVGGAVRDKFRGVEAHDRDYCVTGVDEEIFAAAFASFVFPLLLSVMILLRETEPFMALIPLVAAWSGDSLALITGMLCGRHKLNERISPNKTVEGFFGGIAGGVIGMLIYGLILRAVGKEAPLALFALIGAVGALSGTLGDLSLSYVKRCCGIKDFGALMPGHGGILDRFDSVLFALPLCWLLIRLFYGSF